MQGKFSLADHKDVLHDVGKDGWIVSGTPRRVKHPWETSGRDGPPPKSDGVRLTADSFPLLPRTSASPGGIAEARSAWEKRVLHPLSHVV